MIVIVFGFLSSCKKENNPNPNKTTSNNIIGSWTVKHWIQYNQRNLVSPIDSGIWIATTTDTMNFNGDLRYTYFLKYTFYSDSTYNSESKGMGQQFLTEYGIYSVYGDSIKIVNNTRSGVGAFKFDITDSIMYFRNHYINNNGVNGHEFKLKRN